MSNSKQQKRLELHKNLVVMLILDFVIFLSILFSSCNAEKKALKPYKQVNSDVDTSYIQKKRELISRVCAANFPIEIKTIIKDSITTKVVKVKDNNEINRLKTLLAKGCPTINIDSIYNALPLDTIYVERLKVTHSVVKDTITNYQLSKQIGVLQNDLNKANAAILIEQSMVTIANEYIAKFKALRDFWRVRFWILLICVVTFVGIKIVAKYRTLPFKI